MLSTLDTVITSRTADSTARGLKNALINGVSSLVSDAGEFQSVFDVGIEMVEKNQLSIKSTGVNTLDEAFAKFDDIGKLFANAGGVANILAATADLYLETGGIIKTEQDSLNEQKDSLEDERLNHEFKMELFEKGLRSKYASLDVLIAGLRSQGNAVTSALSNLPGFGDND